MPRFVLLAHDWPTPHVDLMLESNGVLKTWRLAAVPKPGVPVRAEPLPDHRLAYLDYEGPVSGGRGSVVRLERGTFTGDLGDTWVVAWQGIAPGVARLDRTPAGDLVFVRS